MVGLVNSAVQQQIPASNAVQGGAQAQQQVQNNQQQEGREDETRLSGTSAAQSQQTETRNNGEDQSQALVASASDQQSGAITGTEERGSIIDVTV